MANDSKSKPKNDAIDTDSPASVAPMPRRVKKKKAKANKALQYRPIGGRKKKEKTQISVRIDTQVMDLLYVIAEKKHQRITDVLEHAGMLAVKTNLEEPLVTEQARFLVAMAKPDEQWLVTLFLCYLRKPSDSLSVFNSMDRETFKKKMYMIGTQSDFHTLLSTFGDSPHHVGDVEREYRMDTLIYLRNQLVHGMMRPGEVLAALGLPTDSSVNVTER